MPGEPEWKAGRDPAEELLSRAARSAREEEEVEVRSKEWEAAEKPK
jgi:hypothetical protein